jgi:hypothetical protein
VDFRSDDKAFIALYEMISNDLKEKAIQGHLTVTPERLFKERAQ